MDGLLRDKTRKPGKPPIATEMVARVGFHCLVDLQAAINRYLAEHNAAPKPFVWTASAASIVAKLDRLPAASV